ncbi:hypothetical protein BB560_002747, partial [Smittium megazygosporum]
SGTLIIDESSHLCGGIRSKNPLPELKLDLWSEIEAAPTLTAQWPERTTSRLDNSSIHTLPPSRPCVRTIKSYTPYCLVMDSNLPSNDPISISGNSKRKKTTPNLSFPNTTSNTLSNEPPSVAENPNSLTHTSKAPKKTILCIFIIENTKKIGSIFSRIFENFISKFITLLREPVLSSENGIPSKVTPCVQLGLVFYGDNHPLSNTSIISHYFTSNYRKFGSNLLDHQFATGGTIRCTLLDGLVAALEMLDDYSGFNNKNSVDLVSTHVVLVGCTPPYGLESLLIDYIASNPEKRSQDFANSIINDLGINLRLIHGVSEERSRLNQSMEYDNFTFNQTFDKLKEKSIYFTASTLIGSNHSIFRFITTKFSNDVNNIDKISPSISDGLVIYSLDPRLSPDMSSEGSPAKKLKLESPQKLPVSIGEVLKPSLPSPSEQNVPSQPANSSTLPVPANVTLNAVSRVQTEPVAANAPLSKVERVKSTHPEPLSSSKSTGRKSKASKAAANKSPLKSAKLQGKNASLSPAFQNKTATVEPSSSKSTNTQIQSTPAISGTVATDSVNTPSLSQNTPQALPPQTVSNPPPSNINDISAEILQQRKLLQDQLNTLDFQQQNLTALIQKFQVFEKLQASELGNANASNNLVSSTQAANQRKLYESEYYKIFSAKQDIQRRLDSITAFINKQTQYQGSQNGLADAQTLPQPQQQGQFRSFPQTQTQTPAQMQAQPVLQFSQQEQMQGHLHLQPSIRAQSKTEASTPSQIHINPQITRSVDTSLPLKTTNSQLLQSTSAMASSSSGNIISQSVDQGALQNSILPSSGAELGLDSQNPAQTAKKDTSPSNPPQSVSKETFDMALKSPAKSTLPDPNLLALQNQPDSLQFQNAQLKTQPTQQQQSLQESQGPLIQNMLYQQQLQRQFQLQQQLQQKQSQQQYQSQQHQTEAQMLQFQGSPKTAFQQIHAQHQAQGQLNLNQPQILSQSQQETQQPQPAESSKVASEYTFSAPEPMQQVPQPQPQPQVNAQLSAQQRAIQHSPSQINALQIVSQAISRLSQMTNKDQKTIVSLSTSDLIVLVSSTNPVGQPSLTQEQQILINTINSYKIQAHQRSLNMNQAANNQSTPGQINDKVSPAQNVATTKSNTGNKQVELTGHSANFLQNPSLQEGQGSNPTGSVYSQKPPMSSWSGFVVSGAKMPDGQQSEIVVAAQAVFVSADNKKNLLKDCMFDQWPARLAISGLAPVNPIQMVEWAQTRDIPQVVFMRNSDLEARINEPGVYNAGNQISQAELSKNYDILCETLRDRSMLALIRLNDTSRPNELLGILLIYFNNSLLGLIFTKQPIPMHLYTKASPSDSNLVTGAQQDSVSSQIHHDKKQNPVPFITPETPKSALLKSSSSGIPIATSFNPLGFDNEAAKKSADLLVNSPRNASSMLASQIPVPSRTSSTNPSATPVPSSLQQNPMLSPYHVNISSSMTPGPGVPVSSKLTSKQFISNTATPAIFSPANNNPSNLSSGLFQDFLVSQDEHLAQGQALPPVSECSTATEQPHQHASNSSRGLTPTLGHSLNSTVSDTKLNTGSGLTVSMETNNSTPLQQPQSLSLSNTPSVKQVPTPSQALPSGTPQTFNAIQVQPHLQNTPQLLNQAQMQTGSSSQLSLNQQRPQSSSQTPNVNQPQPVRNQPHPHLSEQNVSLGSQNQQQAQFQSQMNQKPQTQIVDQSQVQPQSQQNQSQELGQGQVHTHISSQINSQTHLQKQALGHIETQSQSQAEIQAQDQANSQTQASTKARAKPK